MFVIVLIKGNITISDRGLLIRKPASLKSMYEMNSLVVFLGDFP